MKAVKLPADLKRHIDVWATAIYASALFVSAALMFLVQPMFAKALLPLLGGAPAVWNTCVVFYELILLAGYWYAFVLQRRLGLNAQIGVHIAIVLAAVAFLPLRVLTPFPPPTSVTAVPWLLITLLISLGIPLFVLSATSPLLQSWFARTPDPRSRDPYFLYASSNAGSMVGLLAYPFVLEPVIGLRAQSLIWMIGYFVLVVFLGLAGLIAFRQVRSGAGAEPAASAAGSIDETDAHVETLAPARKLRWVLLAFVPSSLMLSVTSFISAEVAPLPLLWVVPLALYLLTLVIAFSGDSEARLRRLYISAPIAVLVLILLIGNQVNPSTALAMLIHLIAFFIIALTCHSMLAADRPAREHLTEFYLWIAIGGALGGVLNAIVAPAVFNGVYEYPLVLVLAAFFLRNPAQPPVSRPRLWDLELPLLLGAALAVFLSIELRRPQATAGTAIEIAFVTAAFLAFVLFRRPLGFAVSVAALLLCIVLVRATTEFNLYAGRNFFGVKTVVARLHYHYLVHGTTIHGIENMQPERRDVPLSYFTRSGPLGQIFTALGPQLRRSSIALVGEGAGSAVCFRTPAQNWTLYEIDPQIDLVARDPHLFAYVGDCGGATPTVIGDARLSLDRAPDDTYDLMILDAYSADYVPVHLLTREAMAMYKSKLRAGGVLAFHATSIWFNLVPELSRLAADAGLTCYVNHDTSLLAAEAATGKRPSIWVAMGAAGGGIDVVARNARWQRCPPTSFRLWTDDYSSLITAFAINISIGPR
ncbi:MAG: fused MFS/spermidine synthase [Candidatus Eremiobacteraeota bacterium]|nr:fused MFS/spermidine synthase [Candidatus Eremiobacteraeota bacterium]MBV8367147.1 fused MFS/spermidine synthase [Candidatus Eremiobacteraeota bacterium]